MGFSLFKHNSPDKMLDELLSLSINNVQKETVEIPDVKKEIKNCIESIENAKTFRSKLAMKSIPAESLGKGGHTDGSGEWRVDFAKPDRFHVLQVLWEKQWPDGAVDEWISIGGQEYLNVVEWQLNPKPNFQEFTRNSLSIDIFFNILRKLEPTSAVVYRHQKNTYLLLEYNNVDVSEIPFASGMQSTSCRVCLWIDLDNYSLAKGEIFLAGQSEDGSKIDGEVQQAFTSYDEDFTIVAPH